MTCTTERAEKEAFILYKRELRCRHQAAIETYCRDWVASGVNYSVNYDKQTVTAMAAAFGAESVAEGYYDEQVGAVLKHDNAAEVAAAGFLPANF